MESGAADIGQGSDTVLAMITAEVLGLDLEDVKVHSGDTDLAVDLGAYSSRTTLMTGHAAKRAAESVKSQLLEVLATKLSVPVEELDLEDGHLESLENEVLDVEDLRFEYLKEHIGFGDRPRGERLTFREVARIAFLERGTIIGTGEYHPPPLGGSFKGAAVGTSPAYGCSAQVAEVSVDLETGEATVERVIAAHDCGFAINRTSVEGQMQGSVMMGLGEALMEQIHHDPQGRVLNANLAEYKIPTTLDMPSVDTVIVESDEPNGPFGAKEVGEGAIMPTIPAVLNAIRDATGAEIQELPATPERILDTLKAKSASPGKSREEDGLDGSQDR